MADLSHCQMFSITWTNTVIEVVSSVDNLNIFILKILDVRETGGVKQENFILALAIFKLKVLIIIQRR